MDRKIEELMGRVTDTVLEKLHMDRWTKSGGTIIAPAVVNKATIHWRVEGNNVNVRVAKTKSPEVFVFKILDIGNGFMPKLIPGFETWVDNTTTGLAKVFETKGD